MRQVSGAKGAADNTKGHPVEFVTFNHRSFGRVRAIGRRAISAEIVLGSEPFGRQAAEGPSLGQHVFPQLSGSARVGINAGHSDDRDGGRVRFQVVG